LAPDEKRRRPVRALTLNQREDAVISSLDSFNCRRTLKVGSKSYVYYDLKIAEKNGLKGASRLPF
jgi:hypothetical protein